jgi:hypothetical protein
MVAFACLGYSGDDHLAVQIWQFASGWLEGFFTKKLSIYQLLEKLISSYNFCLQVVGNSFDYYSNGKASNQK